MSGALAHVRELPTSTAYIQTHWWLKSRLLQVHNSQTTWHRENLPTSLECFQWITIALDGQNAPSTSIDIHENISIELNGRDCFHFTLSLLDPDWGVRNQVKVQGKLQRVIVNGPYLVSANQVYVARKLINVKISRKHLEHSARPFGTVNHNFLFTLINNQSSTSHIKLFSASQQLNKHFILKQGIQKRSNIFKKCIHAKMLDNLSRQNRALLSFNQTDVFALNAKEHMAWKAEGTVQGQTILFKPLFTSREQGKV